MTDDARLDELLNELVVTEPREAWDDVVARARRARRRYAAAVVAIATLVLAPSAWAIHHAWSASQTAASGISLSAPQTPTPPAADAKAAVTAATRAYPDRRVLSYEFAHCVDVQSVPRLDEDCWAVFLDPGSERGTGGGPTRYGPSDQRFGPGPEKATYFLVLVRPSDDKVIEGASGSSP